VWHDGSFKGLAESFEVLGVEALSVSGDEIVVRYLNYAAGDPLCCPSQPSVETRYHWSGLDLVGATPIPEGAYREKIPVEVSS
jgi:hypothetical protein